MIQGASGSIATFAFPKDEEFKIVERATNQVSQYGVSPSCVENGSLERLAMSTVRYQFKGQQEFIIFKWEDIKQIVTQTQGSLSLVERISNFARTMTTEVAQTVFAWRGVVEPKSILYIPRGCFFCSRVLGTTGVFGLRCGSHDLLRVQDFVDFVDTAAMYPSEPMAMSVWRKLCLSLENSCGQAELCSNIRKAMARDQSTPGVESKQVVNKTVEVKNTEEDKKETKENTQEAENTVEVQSGVKKTETEKKNAAEALEAAARDEVLEASQKTLQLGGAAPSHDAYLDLDDDAPDPELRQAKDGDESLDEEEEDQHDAEAAAAPPAPTANHPLPKAAAAKPVLHEKSAGGSTGQKRKQPENASAARPGKRNAEVAVVATSVVPAAKRKKEGTKPKESTENRRPS